MVLLKRHEIARRTQCFPVAQNVGKRDSALGAALGLFQKANCDRLSDRIARR